MPPTNTASLPKWLPNLKPCCLDFCPFGAFSCTTSVSPINRRFASTNFYTKTRHQSYKQTNLDSRVGFTGQSDIVFSNSSIRRSWRKCCRVWKFQTIWITTFSCWQCLETSLIRSSTWRIAREALIRSFLSGWSLGVFLLSSSNKSRYLETIK